MPTYDLDGVPVEFPYQAYECQLAYMRAVVHALSAGENALLESPTGTGKTLCLLCAALGWRRHREKVVAVNRTSWEAQNDPSAAQTNTCPRIWYASRTHSQLRQVVGELKRTSYRPSSVVLGSREHFCIHGSVGRHTGAKQNAMCKRARGENRCPFYVGFRKGQGNKVDTSALDIEEIVSACKECRVCPFYKTREEAKTAELLFIPYDYLINPQTRESLGVALKNTILIFDEGHNIEKSCESAASFELRSEDLAQAISEIDDARDTLESELCSCEEALGDMTAEQLHVHLNRLKKSLLALEDSVLAEKLEEDPVTERVMNKSPGSHILRIFERGSHNGDGIAPKDAKRISTVVQKAIAVQTFNMESHNSGGLYLDKLQSLLHVMYKPDPKELDANYQVLVYEDTPEDAKRGTKRKAMDFFSGLGSARTEVPRTLCLWCFSCSVALRELTSQGVHSVIITSGTLSPIEGTVEAFGVPFPVVLQNKHVIDARKQVWAGALRAGPNGAVLNASFANRDNPAYIRDLAQIVGHVASCVPDGMLLAFNSYAQKETMLKSWRQTGAYDDIFQHKPIFEEPKGHLEMQHMMESFNRELNRERKDGHIGGAILAAVCRGKLCEGIDFSDRQCRMVVLVGIPYPNRSDLRVILKQTFLDQRGAQGEGRLWYTREAIRTVNQTLGRVIRHRDDFGGILLCDERYAMEGRLTAIARGLSSWLLPQVAVLNSFEEAVAGCRRFFGTFSPTPTAPAAPAGAAPAAVAAPAAAAARVRGEQEPRAARTGAASAKATAVSTGLGAGGAIALSALGALWKRRQPGALAAGQPAAGQPAVGQPPLGARLSAGAAAAAPPGLDAASRTPSAPSAPSAPARGAPASGAPPAGGPRGFGGAGAPAGAPGLPGLPGLPVARALRTPATPQAVQLAGPAGDGAVPGLPAALAKPGLAAQAAAAARSDVREWLRTAEALLPRMELERTRAQVMVMLKEADVMGAPGAFGGRPGPWSAPAAEGAEERFLASLKCVAESVLPEFCFDSPDDERCREALVKGCALLLPRLLRPLWKSSVEELLRSRGSPAPRW